MKEKGVILLFAALGMAGIDCSSASGIETVQSPVADYVLIKNITLIDGTGNSPQAAMDVLLGEGKIQTIGKDVATPQGAETIDGTGRFLIPGLVNTHVHLNATMYFQLSPEEKQEVVDYTPHALLYNGVTTILNLSSEAEWIWRLRESQRTGRITAPRIYATGEAFHPKGGWGSMWGSLVTSEDARRRAEEYVAQETDGFKIMLEDGLGDTKVFKMMPEEMSEAILGVAKQNNLPVYLHAIDLEAYRRAVTMRPQAIVHGLEDPLLEGDPLVNDLVKNNIIVIPTLSLFEAFLTLKDGFEDPVLRASVPDFLLKYAQDPDYLTQERELAIEDLRLEAYQWARKKIPIFRENVTKMLEAGVKLAVGTDAGGKIGGYDFHGYMTPWEMESLVECGLTPMEALVAATRSGAEVIGVEDQLGTVEPGKWADLLILSANPLEDIRNVRKIELIILGGKIHERSEFAYQ